MSDKVDRWVDQALDSADQDNLFNKSNESRGYNAYRLRAQAEPDNIQNDDCLLMVICSNCSTQRLGSSGSWVQ